MPILSTIPSPMQSASFCFRRRAARRCRSRLLDSMIEVGDAPSTPWRRRCRRRTRGSATSARATDCRGRGLAAWFPDSSRRGWRVLLRAYRAVGGCREPAGQAWLGSALAGSRVGAWTSPPRRGPPTSPSGSASFMADRDRAGRGRVPPRPRRAARAAAATRGQPLPLIAELQAKARAPGAVEPLPAQGARRGVRRPLRHRRRRGADQHSTTPRSPSSPAAPRWRRTCSTATPPTPATWRCC